VIEYTTYILLLDTCRGRKQSLKTTKYLPALISFIALRTEGSGIISTISMCSMLYPYSPITCDMKFRRSKWGDRYWHRAIDVKKASRNSEKVIQQDYNTTHEININWINYLILRRTCRNLKKVNEYSEILLDPWICKNRCFNITYLMTWFSWAQSKVRLGMKK